MKFPPVLFHMHMSSHPVLSAGKRKDPYPLDFPNSKLRRSTLHDAILDRGDLWPLTYDGRAIVTDSYRDAIAGMPLEENVKQHKHAVEMGDMSRRVAFA